MTADFLTNFYLTNVLSSVTLYLVCLTCASFSIDTEEATKVDSGLKILLSKCKNTSISVTNSSLELPTFWAEDGLRVEYNSTSYELANGGCEQDNASSFSTISIQNYTALRKKRTIGALWRYNMIVQEGFLSVAYRNYSALYPPSKFCVKLISGYGEELIAELNVCSSHSVKPVPISKCCPPGMISHPTQRCVSDSLFPKNTPWHPKVLDTDFHGVKHVETSTLFPNLKCNQSMTTMFADNCNKAFHPLTDGDVVILNKHRGWTSLNTSGYCFDLEFHKDEYRNVLMFCRSGSSNMDSAKKALKSTLYMVGMYIGGVFNLFTSMSYLITWNKQNVHGRTLCSCCISLLFLNVTLGTVHLLTKVNHEVLFCYIIAILTHYFYVATFAWLLVVNFDMWKTFGALRADRGAKNKRFLGYSAFGWGLPLVFVAFSIAMDNVFKCRLTHVPVPEYGLYYCFVAPWAQGYYLYSVVGILIIVSICLSFATLIGFCKARKQTSSIRSTKQAQDKEMIIVLLKMIVIMGLTWIFEWFSWLNDHRHVIWILFDAYNILSAVLLFVILVCSHNTLRLLKQTFPRIEGAISAVSSFHLSKS